MTLLRRAHLPEATELLVRAFDEDPYFRFLAPDTKTRARLVGGVMSSYLALALPRSVARVVLTDEQELRGICLWYPPEAYPAPAHEIARVYTSVIGPALLKRHLSATTILNALRMGQLLEEAQPDGPHYYLQVLGVDPRWHGRGTGSALLRERLAEADAAGLPAMLETTKPMNVRLYRRYGFEIVRTTKSDSSPPVWTMVRPAQTT